MEHNFLIAVIVIGARLLVPLLIPRFPLPAIIACMLIDAADQSIFQRYTTINLDNYQSYDKALDIYYLSIAYLSTFKNWKNQAAVKISQFLFYYRLVGVLLYEFIHNGWLLFIFPNTFEYFFIFFSSVALFYNMKKFSTKFLVGAAAFIWIFIKLPQEYWIHIAHMDTTDFIKERIFHVPATTSFEQIFVMFPWVIPALGIAALILGIIVWQVAKRLPKPDHKLQISPVIKESGDSKYMETPKSLMKYFEKYRSEFIEKLVLVGLVSIIFAEMLPSFQGTIFQLIVGVSLVILGNAVFGYVLLHSSKFGTSILNKFFPMFIVNACLAFLYANIMSGPETSVSYLTVLFFAYIITLLTVLYDRFRPFYLERFAR
jgi:hypothetical protein